MEHAKVATAVFSMKHPFADFVVIDRYSELRT
jgi:hypothetical protein